MEEGDTKDENKAAGAGDDAGMPRDDEYDAGAAAKDGVPSKARLFAASSRTWVVSE